MLAGFELSPKEKNMCIRGELTFLQQFSLFMLTLVV